MGLNVWAYDYPTHPDLTVTPGALCEHADAKRYPEKINYCNRDVSTDEKFAVIAVYENLGYKIMALDRKNFKIDHFIPLCMGGSNEATNLWPQYKTIYVRTDDMERELCEQMSEGRLSQADAIKKITEAKMAL
jgi:hypothetical protein